MLLPWGQGPRQDPREPTPPVTMTRRATTVEKKIVTMRSDDAVLSSPPIAVVNALDAELLASAVCMSSAWEGHAAKILTERNSFAARALLVSEDASFVGGIDDVLNFCGRGLGAHFFDNEIKTLLAGLCKPTVTLETDAIVLSKLCWQPCVRTAYVC